MMTVRSVVRGGIALLALAAVACGEGAATSTDASGDAAPVTGAAVKRAALESWVANVIQPTYTEFRAAAAALEAAAADLAEDPTDARREAAQDAWRAAMVVWQRAEVFQFGPAGVMGKVQGGEDLRDAIYSWPLVNRCRVDQETAEQSYVDVAGFASEPVNVRGLDALEYLLWNEDAGNACAPNSTLNTSGAWAALSAAEVTARRAAYAHTLSQLLVGHADALVAAWQVAPGTFGTELVTAGEGSAAFMNLQEALNAVSDALFYVDQQTKDAKLARPAGLANCAEATCPDAVESPFARASKEQILANLRGFQAFYLGAPAGEEGTGFDDILVAVGAETLAADMATRIEDAITAVAAIPGTLTEALAADRDAVVAAHAAVKGVTDLLKTQFLSVLDLEPPASAASDND